MPHPERAIEDLLGSTDGVNMLNLKVMIILITIKEFIKGIFYLHFYQIFT